MFPISNIFYEQSNTEDNCMKYLTHRMKEDNKKNDPVLVSILCQYACILYCVYMIKDEIQCLLTLHSNLSLVINQLNYGK